MRTTLYLQLAAVIVCTVFSLADRGNFVSETVSRITVVFTMPLLFPLAMLAWLACPVAVMVLCYRTSDSKQHAWALLAEIVLWIAQVLVLLPAVQ